MKLIVAIVAMVLLSGAAWACDWCKLPEYQKLKIGDPQAWAQIKSGVSITAPDPAAWKQGSVYEEKGFHKVEKDRYIKVDDPMRQSDSLKECRRLQSQGYAIGCLEDDSEWELIQKEKPPWADSRYRLEKNEVTGKCRVTEFRDNRWQNASAFDIFDGCSCENASKRLEEYRQSERENKAWRPIK